MLLSRLGFENGDLMEHEEMLDGDNPVWNSVIQELRGYSSDWNAGESTVCWRIQVRCKALWLKHVTIRSDF